MLPDIKSNSLKKNAFIHIIIHFMRPILLLRIHSRFSTNLKTSKKMYEVLIFDMQNYVYSEDVFNALYIEIKHTNVKKISFG